MFYVQEVHMVCGRLSMLQFCVIKKRAVQKESDDISMKFAFTLYAVLVINIDVQLLS